MKPNGKCEHLQPYSNKDIDACYVVNNQILTMKFWGSKVCRA